MVLWVTEPEIKTPEENPPGEELPQEDPREEPPEEPPIEDNPPAEEPPEDNPPEEPLRDDLPGEQERADALAARPEIVDALSSSGAGLLEDTAENSVTVTYDANGGDTGAVSASVRAGEPYGVQPEAARRGYAFDGWWTGRDGGERVMPETVVTQTEDHTLYAHWRERGGWSVTFDGNGGRVKSKQVHMELSEGERFGELPVPLREGYDFLGWYTAPEDGEEITGERVFDGGRDLTLYAHWAYNPYAFWSFTLGNRTQQVYLCQQASLYFEAEQDNVTWPSCPLISATGSLNIAEDRAEAATTDDWVRGKRPKAVVKCVDGAGRDAARQALSARFPEQEVILVTPAALGSGNEALYAQLALAKHLYGDWYADVELNLAAEELGVTELPIYF